MTESKLKQRILPSKLFKQEEDGPIEVINSENSNIVNSRILNKTNLKLWTTEKVRELFVFYKLYGSKWSTIATRFSGMTENDVKNKFYSTLKSIAYKFRKEFPLASNHKKELVKYVDIALTYQELLTKENTPKEVELKQENSGYLKNITQTIESFNIWPSNFTSENDAFMNGFSKMIWNNAEGKNDYPNLTAGDVSGNGSGEELKT